MGSRSARMSDQEEHTYESAFRPNYTNATGGSTGGQPEPEPEAEPDPKTKASKTKDEPEE
jgi:hypothetical protein